MGSRVALHVCVLWHWPEPSTVILAKGSGRPERNVSLHKIFFMIFIHFNLKDTHETDLSWQDYGHIKL